MGRTLDNFEGTFRNNTKVLKDSQFGLLRLFQRSAENRHQKLAKFLVDARDQQETVPE
jgi:hypothetical protein